MEGGACADAHQDALGLAQHPGSFIRLLGGDAGDAVVNARIQHAGDEIGADALEAMGSRLAAGEQRGIGGLHGHDLHAFLLFLQVSARAGDGAAGAHASHEDVHFPIGILPDLGAGGTVMGGGVGRVIELVGDEAVGNRFRQLPGLLDGCGHTLAAGGQHQLGTVGAHEHPALQAHGVGHDDDGPVATSRRHQGKTNAGVAGGGLDDGGAGLQDAPLLSVVDHGQTHPVLDGTGGVEIFQLRQQPGLQTQIFLHMGQLQQRGGTDQLLGGSVNVGHKGFLLVRIVVTVLNTCRGGPCALPLIVHGTMSLSAYIWLKSCQF